MASAAPTISSVRPDPYPGVASAYEAYAHEIGAYVSRGFGHSVTVEDVVQEAFARLVRVTAEGQAPALVRPWLYRVAHNLAVDRFRRDHGSPEDVEALGDVREGPADEYETITSIDEVRAALARVPEPGRSALLLAAAGYTGPEVARALGRSEGATRTLLCRSRRSLRAFVAEGGNRRGGTAS